MPLPDSHPYIWALAGLTILLVAVIYVVTRMRQVPEGYMAVIEKMDQFERTDGPGRYWLRPMEEEVTRIYVRQREATANIPNVSTDGGLIVAVNLRFAYALDPNYMNSSEIYYADEQRWEQIRTLLKSAFGEVMSRMAQLQQVSGQGGAQVAAKPAAQPATQAGGSPSDSAKSKSPAPVDMTIFFGPFAGPKAPAFRDDLNRTIRATLKRHGIIVTDEPVVINGLVPPSGVIEALTELQSSEFSSAAKAKFLWRLGTAAPDISEATLVQLFNILQNHGVDMHAFFSNGMLNPQALTLLSGGQPSVLPVIGPPSSQGNGGGGSTSGSVNGQAAGTAPSDQSVHVPDPQPAHASHQAQGQETGRTTAPASPLPPVVYADPGCAEDYGVSEEDNALVRGTRE